MNMIESHKNNYNNLKFGDIIKINFYYVTKF